MNLGMRKDTIHALIYRWRIDAKRSKAVTTDILDIRGVQPLAAAEDVLIDNIADCYNDPLEYVEFIFPWGEMGSPLEDEAGPDDWQKDILNKIRTALEAGTNVGEAAGAAIRIAIASGHGIGKVISNRSITYTPSGEKQWGDVELGDELFGSSGAPTRVTAKFPHTDWMFYKVTFDDGSFAYAGLEHLWAVRGRQERRNRLLGWRTMSTEDILNAGVKRPNGAAMARQWEIPAQGPAQFEEREIDLHPYVLGVWLGDGSKGQPSFCKPFPEIKARIESLGYKVNTAADGKQQRLQGVNGLFSGGVFELTSPDRFIPQDYKFNTVENRRELLRGLLDTDGEVNSAGTIGYSSTSKQLIEDVIWLVRSLGGKACLQPTPKEGWYPGEDGERIQRRTCYRATINLDWNPFTLAHRAAAYKPSEHRYLVRWIDSIEFDHYGDGHCVTVDAEDSLYCTQEFIVTHNTAVIAWIIKWFIATRHAPQIVVTASSQAQLSNKTWRELAKWHKLALDQHWYKWTATKYYQLENPETWFATAVPWSEHNPDAFAGTHEKHVLIIYDEASAIADPIWSVTEGALTTPGTIWLAFGNYTKNTGKFHECFAGKTRDRWYRMQIDARKCKHANQTVIKEWIDDYGEDSDFVRIRVRGVAPRSGANQFIGQDLVDRCLKYKAEGFETAPKILVLDVARFGDNKSVCGTRQGRKVKILQKWMGLATDQLTDRFIEIIEDEQPDAIVVDGDGIGGAVVDNLTRRGYNKSTMKGHKIILFEFHGAETPNDPKQWYNRRAECWGIMRNAMKDGFQIDDDKELVADLVGPEYTFQTKGGFDVILLESKADMQARGLASPDNADMLMMSFSVKLSVKRKPPPPKQTGLLEGFGGTGTTFMAN